MEPVSLAIGEEDRLRKFERRVIRGIYGLNKTEDWLYRRLSTKEVKEKLKGENTVRIIKAYTQWIGIDTFVGKKTEQHQ